MTDQRRAAAASVAHRAAVVLSQGPSRLDVEQLILAAFAASARGIGWPEIREVIRLAEMAPAATGDDRERHAREGKAGGGSSAPTQDEGVDPGPSGHDQPASPDPSLARLGRLEAEVERLNSGVDALRSYVGGLLDGLMRKVGANGSTDPHSLDHRVAELERQAKTAGQTASATKNGSNVENPSQADLTPEQQTDLDRRQRMLDAVRIAAERVEQSSDITDEELAEMESTYDGFCYQCNSQVADPRLIAALRASRAEVERLEGLLCDEGIDPRPGR